MREYQKVCQQAGIRSVGSLKEFRQRPDFAGAVALSAQAVSDISSLAKTVEITPYQITDVLTHLHLVDINDCLYHQYCIRERVNFYTFDHDFESLDASSFIHII